MPLIQVSVTTSSREILVDITGTIQDALTKQTAAGFTGVASIFVPHTTAGITINEGADPSVTRDILAGLARLIPRDGDYRHAEGNSDAHLKTSLVGSQLTVPVEQGRLRLGTWQSIYLAEFDGPRTRKIWITTIPTGE